MDENINFNLPGRSVYSNLCDAAWLVLFGGNLPIYMYAYLELYIFIVPIMN